jgi:hypothetical protein
MLAAENAFRWYNLNRRNSVTGLYRHGSLSDDVVFVED